MRYSGIYFIPIHGATQDASAQTLSSIVAGIESHFEFATRQSPWSMSHRLLRSVPIPNVPAQPQAYQHILYVSYLSRDRTYLHIHDATPASQPSVKPEPSNSLNPAIKDEPRSQAGTPQPAGLATTTAPSSNGTITSIPGNQSRSHADYLTNQLSPLWSGRHSLHVPDGITYTAGQYILNIGELRMNRAWPSASSNSNSPGVVVCITTVAGSKDEDEDEGYASVDGAAGEEDAVDFEDVQGEIRALWDAFKSGIDFGKAEVREVMMGRDALREENEKDAIVRMWCEVLKLRG